MGPAAESHEWLTAAHRFGIREAAIGRRRAPHQLSYPRPWLYRDGNVWCD